MVADSSTRAYPAGTGFAIGFALGALVGVLVWTTSGNVVLGVILFAATGTALGVAIERAIETRPLSPRERRIVLAALLVGLLLLVLVAVGLVGV